MAEPPLKQLKVNNCSKEGRFTPAHSYLLSTLSGMDIERG